MMSVNFFAKKSVIALLLVVSSMCSDCGISTSAIHQHRFQKRASGHRIYCDDCLNLTDWEPHVEDSNGYCTICGYDLWAKSRTRS